MKEKPVVPLVLSMALPMVFSMLVNALYNIIDSIYVARISESALTALSLVFPLQNLISAAAIGFGIGINAVMSFYIGAEEQKKADQAASQGILLSIMHGVILMIGCLLVLPGFLKMYTSQAEVYADGMAYAGIVFGFALVTNVSIALEKIFQAAGRMKTSMAAMTAGCLTNIILDPCMIFGWGFFPAMGISGAAIATVIGQAVTLIWYIAAGIVHPLPVRISAKDMKLNGKIVRRLYGTGLPSILSLSLPSLMISALNAILASFGPTEVLVLGIYYKLQNFLYLPANGFIQGMRPLAGYNYGAGEYERVRKIIWTVLVMCIGIMVIGMIICALWPDQLMGLFTASEETIAAGHTALRLIAIGFPVSAVSVTVCGALEGLSRGMPSLLLSLCRYLAVLVPCAFVLSHVMGVNGVWHAFWISETVTACIAGSAYRKEIIRRLQEPAGRM
jgi:putative MATE family efflux protein